MDDVDDLKGLMTRCADLHKAEQCDESHHWPFRTIFVYTCIHRIDMYIYIIIYIYIYLLYIYNTEYNIHVYYCIFYI